MPPPTALELSVADRWIRSRFGSMVATVEKSLAEYRFDYAAAALYEFTWYEFCDWYLELTKPVLQSESSSPAARAGTRRTLLEILEALQRALHPFMPFITEEVWQRVAPLAGRSGPTVMLAPYPRPADFPRDEASEHEVRWLQSFILAVRQIRGEMNIAPSRRIPLLLRNAAARDLELIERHQTWLERLAGIEPPAPLAPSRAGAARGDGSRRRPHPARPDGRPDRRRRGSRAPDQTPGPRPDRTRESPSPPGQRQLRPQRPRSRRDRRAPAPRRSRANRRPPREPLKRVQDLPGPGAV